MSLAVALARHLDTNVTGVTYDQMQASGNTFIATMPSTPDLAVAITPSGGIPWNGHGSLPTDEPTLQIRVRSDEYDPRPGLDLIDDIYHELVGLHGQAIDVGGDAETYIHRTLFLQTGPASIGRDANQRTEFVINPIFRIRALSTHRST